MTIDTETRLNELLQEAGLSTLDSDTASRFAEYLSLLIRWNQTINLTAIRDEEQILARHFVESIACARALPAGIETLLDFGSGAGFPGIPIALIRPEIGVTLAESQGRKAAFLLEAGRVLEIKAKIHTGRAEILAEKFDCVTLRAVDKMKDAVQMGAVLVAQRGWLALMTTSEELPTLQHAAGAGLAWSGTIPLPGSRDRLLALGQKGADASSS